MGVWGTDSAHDATITVRNGADLHHAAVAGFRRGDAHRRRGRPCRELCRWL